MSEFLSNTFKQLINDAERNKVSNVTGRKIYQNLINYQTCMKRHFVSKQIGK